MGHAKQGMEQHEGQLQSLVEVRPGHEQVGKHQLGSTSTRRQSVDLTRRAIPPC